MSVRKYLPSAQFATIVGALAISGGLVIAAQYVTNRPTGPTSLTTASDAPQQQDWQKTLDEIQASSGVTLPNAPDQATVDKLVAGVQSSNLTNSVARSLLIKLTDAKAQGLGDDIPTQNQLIADATASLQQQQQASTTVYNQSDLATVAQTKDSLRNYGNEVMRVFAAHDQAKTQPVLLAAGQAVDYNDNKYLSTLPAIQADYLALARDLAATPVPSTLVPLHLEVVNDLAAMGSAVGDMRSLVSDPLRGLMGLQSFESAGNEATRVLTTIADTFSKSGILFNKDEPGASWSAFVSGS